MSFRPSLVVLALGLALGACGSEGDGEPATGFTGGGFAGTGVTSAGVSGRPFGGQGGRGGAGGSGFAGSFGSSGAGGFSGFSGFGGFGGSGGSGGGSGFPPVTCPVDMPEDGSECMGRRLNCMFGMLQCLCVRSRWSCDSPPDDMDAGLL